MKNNNHFAEVLESSLVGWLAQSWQWDYFPPFGSLVMIKTKKRDIFGIVHQVQTGTTDSIRQPFPYQKTEEELLNEQPQIFEFLKTTFSCLTIGYQEHDDIFYLLSPEPPKIHSFVSSVSKDRCKQFFASEKYVHVICNLSAHIFNLEELMLAILKQQKELDTLSSDVLNTFVRTYSLLNGNEYRRIKLFLQRVEHIIR